MCFNKKVVAGSVFSAVVVLALAPGAFRGAVLFLVFAACPLSMAVMMRRTSGPASRSPEAATHTDTTPRRPTAANPRELEGPQAERSATVSRTAHATEGRAGNGPPLR